MRFIAHQAVLVMMKGDLRKRKLLVWPEQEIGESSTTNSYI